MTARQFAACLEPTGIAARNIARPGRLIEETFDAFRIKPNGDVYGDLRGNPEPIASGESLEQCAGDAVLRCVHKAQFAIRHTDHREGTVTLHIYQVRQKSTPTYVFHDHQHHRIQRLYEEKIATVRIDALAVAGGAA